MCNVLSGAVSIVLEKHAVSLFFTFSNKWKPKLSVICSGKSQTTVNFYDLSWPLINVRAALTSCEHNTVKMFLEVLNLSAAFQPYFTEMALRDY